MKTAIFLIHKLGTNPTTCDDYATLRNENGVAEKLMYCCDKVCLIDMRYVYNMYEKNQIVSISERKVSDKGHKI